MGKVKGSLMRDAALPSVQAWVQRLKNRPSKKLGGGYWTAGSGRGAAKGNYGRENMTKVMVEGRPEN